MDGPLDMGNVCNMSLESYSSSNKAPNLVARFSCDCESIIEWLVVGEDVFIVCCAVIHLHDSQNITLKGISVTRQAPGMSSVVFRYVLNITLQFMTVTSLILPELFDIQIGILIHSANFFEVYSSYVSNHSEGFVLLYTTNTYLTNITVVNNRNTVNTRAYTRGMYLGYTTNTTVVSPTAMQNTDGMHFKHTTNTTIVDALVKENLGDGMLFFFDMSTIILNAFVMDHTIGITFRHSVNAFTTNSTVQHSYESGILLENSTNTSLINSTSMFSVQDGITLIQSDNTDIIHATLMYNRDNGISISLCTNTCINNTHTYAENDMDVSRVRECCFIFIVSSTHTIIYNSSFTDIKATSNGASSADPTSLPAVIVLYYSSLHISGCNFTENSISAVKAYASNITTSGDLVLSNNRAMAGAVFVLVQNSVVELVKNSHMHFTNNHATNTGGVFHITDNVNFEAQPSFYKYYKSGPPLLRSACFLNSEGSRSQVSLTFVNNSAGKGGDILYGGQVAYGLDGDWNCLQSFKNISNIAQSGLSLITSDPSRVCLCDGIGQPDCLTVEDPTPHSVYPGQSLTLTVVVVGQGFGTVAGSVHAQFLPVPDNSPQLDTGQGVQSVTQEKCNSLSFTVFSTNEVSSAVLTLTATDEVVSEFVVNDIIWLNSIRKLWKEVYHTSELDPLKFIHHPVYVNISILPCPAGFMLTSELPFRCECNLLLQSFHGVRCYIEGQTIGQSGLVWVGTLKDDNGSVVGSEYCLFGYCNKGDSNVTLSDPDSQCNYNHSGTLCGGCQPGLSLALGSAQCLQCTNQYLALLIPFTLAGPAVVFLTKILDLTISQGTINGLIFYANIVKANEYILLPLRQTNPLTLFIAWLNLDLGIETCFFNGLTAYTKAWLQFVFPLYISSIAGLIIISAKYSDRVAKLMGNNSVPVLATLFLLSYAKLFRTIITTLSYTMLYSSQGHKAVWSADGNVDYLGPKHIPLFAVAVAALFFLWLPYTLLLLLGQWLHKCNCRPIEHFLMKIKPFLDAHYGPLKGKHHYWFGCLLLVRAIVLLMSALIPTDHAVIVTFSISVFAILLNYFGLIVYRSITVAMYDISFFMNLALFGVTSFFIKTVGGNQMVAAYTLIGIAFVQFLGLIVFKVFLILKKSEKVTACLCKRQPVEDDWELYEEAALQREMESDQESEEYSSTDSLPTY